jgi:hypothetical protein
MDIVIKQALHPFETHLDNEIEKKNTHTVSDDGAKCVEKVNMRT